MVEESCTPVIGDVAGRRRTDQNVTDTVAVDVGVHCQAAPKCGAGVARTRRDRLPLLDAVRAPTVEPDTAAVGMGDSADGEVVVAVVVEIGTAGDGISKRIAGAEPSCVQCHGNGCG